MRLSSFACVHQAAMRERLRAQRLGQGVGWTRIRSKQCAALLSGDAALPSGKHARMSRVTFLGSTCMCAASAACNERARAALGRTCDPRRSRTGTCAPRRLSASVREAGERASPEAVADLPRVVQIAARVPRAARARNDPVLPRVSLRIPSTRKSGAAARTIAVTRALPSAVRHELRRTSRAGRPARARAGLLRTPTGKQHACRGASYTTRVMKECANKESAQRGRSRRSDHRPMVVTRAPILFPAGPARPPLHARFAGAPHLSRAARTPWRKPWPGRAHSRAAALFSHHLRNNYRRKNCRCTRVPCVTPLHDTSHSPAYTIL